MATIEDGGGSVSCSGRLNQVKVRLARQVKQPRAHEELAWTATRALVLLLPLRYKIPGTNYNIQRLITQGSRRQWPKVNLYSL